MDPDGTEQMESDLEAANQEILEATSAQDKTKGELAALKETMKIQQVRTRIHEHVVTHD